MKRKSISYAKWGYIFIAPFFIVYAIFQLWPLITTIYYSFFQRYQDGFVVIGPNFVGFDNYVSFFTEGTTIWNLLSNTVVMWIIGFIPQLAISLLFAYWFTNKRLDLKCTTVFKSIIYMPNLIMASAFSMLIFAIFAETAGGPVNQLIGPNGLALTTEPVKFFSNTISSYAIIAFVNFIMWFGNTTILLMSAMLGVDESLVEAADIDGCTPNQIFWKITMPLIKPIMIYVFITSLVGGLQMFDIPQIITEGVGGPNGTTKTLIMYLNQNLANFNYGVGGAISVVLFIICGAFSMLVYYFFTDRNLGGARSFEGKKVKKAKKGA